MKTCTRYSCTQQSAESHALSLQDRRPRVLCSTCGAGAAFPAATLLPVSCSRMAIFSCNGFWFRKVEFVSAIICTISSSADSCQHAATELNEDKGVLHCELSSQPWPKKAQTQYLCCRRCCQSCLRTCPSPSLPLHNMSEFLEC